MTILDTGVGYDFPTYLKENELLFATEAAVPTMLWVDAETTGLDRQGNDHVLELAAVATDRYGRAIADGVFHTYLYNTTWYANQIPQDSAFARGGNAYGFMWENLNDFVANMHKKSGLRRDHQSQWKDGFFEEAFNMRIEIASQRFTDWAIGIGCEAFKLPMAGSTVEFDRALLGFDAPDIEQFFHYRTINISSFKEVCRLTNPQLYTKWKSMCPDDVSKDHRAIKDIAWSIREYRFYLENFLIVGSDIWDT